MRRTLVIALAAALGTLAAACEAGSAREAAGRADAAVETGRAASQRAASSQQAGATLDIGYAMGDPDAPIRVVEFSDFGCPYCARFARATFPTVVEEYIDAGTIRWRFVPIVFGFAGGELMGSAAVCAARQGGDEMFWRAHDLLYARQQALRGDNARPALLDWLAELGVDRAALDACIDAPETGRLLETHTETAIDWYVRGTPTFLVNGVPMAGALPIEFFRRVFATVLDPSGL